jgi:CheY-like chemotaxis protein
MMRDNNDGGGDMAVIVTAEDHDDIRIVTTRALQRAGHTVVATPDGAQALDAVRLHRPDIVITDVDMPRLTGLQVCRAIRDDPDLQAIPVMLVSGSIHPDDPRAVEAGATDILPKPFLPSDLLDRVTALLAGDPATTPRPR